MLTSSMSLDTEVRVKIPEDKTLFLDCLTLKMKTLSCFEISVAIYQFTWHKIPEDLSLYHEHHTLHYKFVHILVCKHHKIINNFKM